jgi:hypothetical protein
MSDKKITIEVAGVPMLLDVSRALELKLLTPGRKPCSVGDVFGSNNHSPALVVQAVWPTNGAQTADRCYSLIGYNGLRSYSNKFFHSLHTLEEIDEYLDEHSLDFRGNVSDMVSDMLAGVVKPKKRSRKSV